MRIVGVFSLVLFDLAYPLLYVLIQFTCVLASLHFQTVLFLSFFQTEQGRVDRKTEGERKGNTCSKGLQGGLEPRMVSLRHEAHRSELNRRPSFGFISSVFPVFMGYGFWLGWMRRNRAGWCRLGHQLGRVTYAPALFSLHICRCGAGRGPR